MGCWVQTSEEGLQQEDLLSECYVPIFPDNYGEQEYQEKVPVDVYNVIVITQTCDLANSKIKLVAVSPIFSLTDFEEVNPSFSNKGRWEEVRKGRIGGLHILPPPTNPTNGRESFVVDFREIYSLPFCYLKRRALNLRPRWRLCSPFRESFSQAFGSYYSRVAVDIPFLMIE
jgi:hypothetical protein